MTATGQEGSRLLYLYGEVMGYNMPVLRAFTQAGLQIHLVGWDLQKHTPYAPPPLDGVSYYRRSEFNPFQLAKLATDLRPTLVYVSGWQDYGYLLAAKQLRAAGIPVVAGFDDQWEGSARQRLAALAAPRLISRLFSHAWVTGSPQYEYARRLGFAKTQIIFDLYSANIDLFKKAHEYRSESLDSYPKGFLCVGRLTEVKGTDLMIDAYETYLREHRGNWPLVCVGNGDLEHLVVDHPQITHVPFASQEELLSIAMRSGAFILPSRHEPWGVVVHEFAAAGMPLILADVVGAASTFLIEGLNGFAFRTGSPEDLAEAMAHMSSLSPESLRHLGDKSAELAGRITPSSSAANLLSLL